MHCNLSSQILLSLIICVALSCSGISVAPKAQTPAPQDDQFAVLVDGLGDYSRRITTNSEMAQRFFDQGLRLVYGYYSPEAIASFKEGLRHDPDDPMLYWGLALAMGPTPNSRFLAFPDDPKEEGRKAIAAARRQAAKASPVEQALIETLWVRYDVDGYLDRNLRDEKYIEAARKLYARYPKDLEAAYLYADALMTRGAWFYWNRDGSPRPGTREAARALEGIMARDPNHPGAVHLYIHLFESSAEPQRALPQARRLESLMPRAGHMVHMPSHIYVRTGHYDKAVASNQRSLMADELFQQAWGDRATPSLGTYGLSARNHARHAWDFIRYAAMQQGNYALALKAATKATAGQAHQGMGAMERHTSMPWLINKVFGKWEAILSEPAPAHGSSYLRGLWHYVRGSALAARGDLESADTELKKIRAAIADPTLKDRLIVANSAATILQLSTHALEGEILLAQGKHDEAVRAFQTALKLQETLKYVEPPDWFQSIRLYLGAALLKAGRPREAETVYREDLREFQNNGWALFGLSQSLRAQTKMAEARKIEQSFQGAWKDADTTLSGSVFLAHVLN